MAVLLCRASQPAPFAGGSTPAPFDRAMLFLLKLFLIFHLILPLYFAAPVLPSGTNDGSQQTRKSGHEVGQVFSGDQLPDGLKKAPIIQPMGSSSLISSFSGYSFNYAPSSVHDGIGKNQANVEETGNPYDLPAVVATQPATSSPSTGSSRNDAFLLRPAPTEQFLPQIPPHKQDQLAKFLPPPNSQRPKLTGWVLGIHEPPVGLREPFPGGEAIVNPATYYMEGADLTRVRPPRCELTACEGPMPNDMDFQLVQEAPTSQGGRTCHRAFVPLNGCLDGRGYLVGMLCSICCDCSAQLAQEMQNSRGWAQGYMAFNNWPERHKR